LFNDEPGAYNNNEARTMVDHLLTQSAGIRRRGENESRASYLSASQENNDANRNIWVLQGASYQSLHRSMSHE
jgi:hypothetical protein